MTNKEGAIITAYTGVLCCEFEYYKKFLEELMGRKVFTHELADKEVAFEIQHKVSPQFLSLINSIKN